MEAVCKVGKTQQRHALVERPGKQVLCWSSGQGQWKDTDVPVSLKHALAKRPAAKIAKKPAGRSSTTEERKEEAKASEEKNEREADDQDQEAEAEEEEEEEPLEDEAEEEQLEDDQAEEEEAVKAIEAEEEEEEEEEEETEEEKEENGQDNIEEEAQQDHEKVVAVDAEKNEVETKQIPKNVEADTKRVHKRPASLMEKGGVPNPLVEGLDFSRAVSGPNIRGYLLARLPGGKKSQVVQITARESAQHDALTKRIQMEGRRQISKGISFNDLKLWAATRKSQLLGGPLSSSPTSCQK